VRNGGWAVRSMVASWDHWSESSCEALDDASILASVFTDGHVTISRVLKRRDQSIMAVRGRKGKDMANSRRQLAIHQEVQTILMCVISLLNYTRASKVSGAQKKENRICPSFRREVV